MYEVKVYHLMPAVHKGDLEEDFVLVSSDIYKTRKAAKNYIEGILRYKNQSKVFRHYHKGNDTSYCGYSTGYTWQNENTGETNEEYYEYRLKKVEVKG